MIEVFRAIGSLGAIVLSWATNHSILWAIFHYFCGWLYIVYWWFEYGGLTDIIRGLMV